MVMGLQLFKIAIGNIVAAPVRHRIELDGVGKLHLVDALEELLELPLMLQRSPCVSVIGSPGQRRLPVLKFDRILVSLPDLIRPYLY